jgi:hypothetical protein
MPVTREVRLLIAVRLRFFAQELPIALPQQLLVNPEIVRPLLELRRGERRSIAISFSVSMMICRWLRKYSGTRLTPATPVPAC